jgi:predicted DNA-binding transcriptional regulator YafY
MGENYNYNKQNSARKQMHYSPNLLSCITNAIDNCKLATIEYDSREKGITVRDIEPMALVYKDRKRHIAGWCRLRNEYRSFRLDRLNTIKVLNEEFARRQDFDLNDFQDNNPVPVDEEEEAED